jgi:aldehyde dehydrogenase (NAD+)
MSVAEILDDLQYGPAPESDAEARAWLARHKEGTRLFIGGAWRAPKSGRFFETTDPATSDVLARVAEAGADDVDDAVAAARKALAKWSARPGHERATVLYAIARMILRKHARLFAVLETLDNGKPIRESRDRRRPARRAPLLPPRRLGPADGASSPTTCPMASAARSSRGISRC